MVDRRANATFVILTRNSDLDGIIRSIRDIEDRFNRKYNYPYVLLNEVPFTEEFKSWAELYLLLELYLTFMGSLRRVKVLTRAQMEFGLISPGHWYQPDWIDEEKAAENRDKLVASNVIYGGEYSTLFISFLCLNFSLGSVSWVYSNAYMSAHQA